MYTKTFWIVITAFASLPPTSVGTKGWFKPCSTDDLENIRKLEERAPVAFSQTDHPVTNPSVFTFRMSKTHLRRPVYWIPSKGDEVG